MPIAHVNIVRTQLQVELSDGRAVSTPLEWFPRLLHATRDERNNWRTIGHGYSLG